MPGDIDLLRVADARGETLSGIGKRYGKATTTLARLNGLGEGGQVRTGQRLRIQ